MRLAVLAVLALGLVAAPAAAQEPEVGRFRIAANLAMGVGGEIDSYANGRIGGTTTSGHGENNLDPSIGFDLRAEYALLDFLAIGGWFEFLGVLVDQTDAEREEYFAIDAYARFRYLFEVIDGTFYIEPYVLLPFGVSFSPLPATLNGIDGGDGDDLWVGWNTAALGGAQFIHESGFGGYLEVGWRHAEVYRNESATLLGTRTELNVSLVVNELALNFGALFAI